MVGFILPQDVLPYIFLFDTCYLIYVLLFHPLYIKIPSPPLWTFLNWATHQRHSAVPVSRGLRLNADLGTFYTQYGTNDSVPLLAPYCMASAAVVAGDITFHCSSL